MDCDLYSNGSNLTVQHSMNTLPVGFCPSTWQDIFNQIAISLIGTLQGTYSSFTIGSNTPSPDDQDKLWLKLDPTTCAPLGWFIYTGGTWKRAVPHSLLPGMIIYHYDAAWAGKTDEQIRTLVEALDNYDSGTPFWYLCDGQNNTPDLRGRFVVGAGDGVGTGTPSLGNGLTGRQQNVTGGYETVQLTFANLPTNTFGLDADCKGIVTERYSTPPATDEKALSSSNTALFSSGLAAFPTPQGQAHDNMSPFRSLYAIMRSSRMI